MQDIQIVKTKLGLVNQASTMGHPVSIELTCDGLLAQFVNHYTSSRAAH